MTRYLLLILTLVCLLSGCKRAFSTMLPEDVSIALPWNNCDGRLDFCDGLMPWECRGRYPESFLMEHDPFDRYVYDRIMMHVAEMAVKFSHERRMKLENSTLQFDGCIQTMRLDFSTMALLEFQQGREILVDITEDFLNRINSDSTIAPLLCHDVLTPADLEIQIDFKCWMGRLVDFDYVGWITLKNGWAHYYAFDMRTDRLDWWQLRNETYYQSYKVVEYTRQAEAEWKQQEIEKLGPSAFAEDRFLYTAPR
jgi:hypothetical protein